MICPVVPFPVTLSDRQPRFQSHGVIFMPIDALSVLCAADARSVGDIAKFLFLPDVIISSKQLDSDCKIYSSVSNINANFK